MLENLKRTTDSAGEIHVLMASFRVMMAHLVYLETLESSVVLVVKVCKHTECLSMNVLKHKSIRWLTCFLPQVNPEIHLVIPELQELKDNQETQATQVKLK